MIAGRAAGAYVKSSFEVQIGIIAACVPTLRHGWKWLYRKMAQRSSRSGHSQLTDEVHLRPYGNGAPMSIAMVTSKNKNHTGDVETSQSLPPLPHIQKTVRVDVDLEPGLWVSLKVSVMETCFPAENFNVAWSGSGAEPEMNM